MPANEEVAAHETADQSHGDDAAVAADAQGNATAAIELIEPSTGEVIVLAKHKPATSAKAAAEEQVTPLAKPEKRKTAKERSQGRLKTKPAEDETTPDTTATAKSNAGAKSAEVLAANEARKARKAADKAKAKEKAKAKPETKPAAKADAKLKKKAGR